MARTKPHSKAWQAALDNGADPEAPFGRTLNGKIRFRPLKGVKGGHRGPSNTTTTGKVQNVNADQTNWRLQLQASRIKFDDDQKKVYLDQLAKHGLKGRAAKEAGVSMQSVRNHAENDPDFAEARDLAVEAYRDKFVDHATTLAFEGEVHRQYDKDGNLLSEKRVFPVRLIELELKRVEPAYRDKQTIDLTTQGGGVLVAPAEMTPQEWIEQQRQANEEKTARPGGEEKKDDG